MPEQTMPPAANEMRITKGKAAYVRSSVIAGNPVANTLPPVFARRNFEDALDKTGWPILKPRSYRARYPRTQLLKVLLTQVRFLLAHLLVVRF